MTRRGRRRATRRPDGLFVGTRTFDFFFFNYRLRCTGSLSACRRSDLKNLSDLPSESIPKTVGRFSRKGSLFFDRFRVVRRLRGEFARHVVIPFSPSSRFQTRLDVTRILLRLRKSQRRSWPKDKSPFFSCVTSVMSADLYDFWCH